MGSSRPTPPGGDTLLEEPHPTPGYNDPERRKSGVPGGESRSED